MNDNDLIDWSVARQTVQGDEELLRELVSTFLEELPRMMQMIHAAIDANDASPVQRAAHTIKGALGHFGAQTGYDLAYRVETCGRSGDMQAAAEAVPALEQAMEKLTPILLDYVGSSDAT